MTDRAFSGTASVSSALTREAAGILQTQQLDVLDLIDRLPDRGLILDLRNHPGGFIWAAERPLQLFTPFPVTPTMFALRATR